MLNENIKNIRKNKGFTQEELAVRLHVTRQTISKWEKGTSVPDAALLSDMAEIFEVSASELLGETAVERQNQDAVIEQLSRINEQMAVRNRRVTRILKALGLLLLIVLVVGATVAILGSRPAGLKPLTTDHLGKLTYVLPDPEFEHEDDDVGVTFEEDGRERISAKIYKNHSDMTEIGVWDYGAYDSELIDEFKEENKDELVEFSGDHGELPAFIDEIIAASDETEHYVGRYYEAYILAGGKMYCVSVENGDDPMGNGELLIATMKLDENQKDEYR